MDPVAAPDFTLPDLDGVARSLADQRGRITVLNFWSVECPWSKHADPAIREAAARAGVDLWTVACCAGEGVEAIRTEATARGLATVLLDPEQRLADAYGAQATPHVFVIDGDGWLRYQGAPDDTGFGFTPPTRSYLEAALAALRAGAPVDPEQTEARGCAIVRAFPRQE